MRSLSIRETQRLETGCDNHQGSLEAMKLPISTAEETPFWRTHPRRIYALKDRHERAAEAHASSVYAIQNGGDNWKHHFGASAKTPAGVVFLPDVSIVCVSNRFNSRRTALGVNRQ